jgi:branched-chain amino acid transport system ATP-binding protein
MTVKENLMIGAYMKRARKERYSALKRVYDLFPVLKEKEDVLSGSLSGGQRQMVAIGRALM